MCGYRKNLTHLELGLVSRSRNEKKNGTAQKPSLRFPWTKAWPTSRFCPADVEIFCAKSLRPGEREVRTEGRKGHYDSIAVGLRADAWCGPVLHPMPLLWCEILSRTATETVPPMKSRRNSPPTTSRYIIPKSSNSSRSRRKGTFEI